jgi:hypothetical protein
VRKDKQSFSSIRERDIDFLLLEELTVDPEFRTWFLRKLGLSPDGSAELIDGWHSVSDSELGESDVEFGIVRSDGTKLLVLVENKINAIFQEDQLERYQKRGEKAVAENWDAFTTGLFAPNAYLTGTDQTDIVNGTITYEAVREWFQERDTSRSKFKADMLTHAIEQKRRGYTPEVDDQVTSLHEYYWEKSQQGYAELGMKQPEGVPAGNLWVRFAPGGLPNDISLIHKMGRGDVDMQFSGAAEDDDSVADQCERLLKKDMRLVTTGKSLSVRIDVPPISEDVDPIKQAEQIEIGLEASQRLLTWYSHNMT